MALVIGVPTYAVKDLGYARVEHAYLNDAGTVAGTGVGDGEYRPFLYRFGRDAQLSADVVQVLGLNGRDQLAVLTQKGPAIWTNRRLKLSAKPEGGLFTYREGGQPAGIDDSGNLVNLFVGMHSIYAVWTWPKKSDVQGWPAVLGVGPDGSVVGTVMRGREPLEAGTIMGYAVIDGKRHNIVGPAKEWVRPLAIGRNHHVAGYFTTPENSGDEPFLWFKGKFQPLPLPRGEQQTGKAVAVNEHGDAVGEVSWVVKESEFSHVGKHAGSLWSKGAWFNLDACVDPKYKLGKAWAINRRGQILAEGMLKGQHEARLLLLTPR